MLDKYVIRILPQISNLHRELMPNLRHFSSKSKLLAQNPYNYSGIKTTCPCIGNQPTKLVFQLTL